MKLCLIKNPEGTITDITNAVTRIEWSGSATQCARTLSFDYVNAPYDNFSLPTVSIGDGVSFSYGQEDEVFFGQIFGTEKSSAVGTITYEATDMMKNLIESTASYNFKNMTAEAIATQVCNDAQINIRFLYPTEVNIASMICDEMTLYDIIMAAYTKAHRVTGDKYFPMIYKRGLGVYKNHWVVKGFTLSDNDNLLSASSVETLDEIINKVKIYDANGNQIGEVSDADSLSLFGTFQQVYKQEDGVDAQTAAKNMLAVTPSQSLKVSAVGDINCLSCYYVYVYDKTVGLYGKYWISSDTHTWEGGSYTMDLDLEFDAIMEEIEINEEEGAL